MWADNEILPDRVISQVSRNETRLACGVRTVELFTYVILLAVMGERSFKMKWLGGGLHMACAPQRDECGKALLSGYIIFAQCACRDVTLMDVTAECAMDGWGLPR